MIPHVPLQPSGAVPGVYGDASHVAQVTLDAFGRSSGSSVLIALAASQTTSGVFAAARIPTLDLVPTAAADWSNGSNKITSVKDPTNPQDAATKNYIDLALSEIATKDDCQAATTTGLAAYTYNNGSSGVGATITLTVSAVLVLDGYTPLLNDRLLIKNETSTNAPYNGIYTVTTLGVLGVTQAVLTRSTDFDQPTDGINGALTFIQHGTANTNTMWSCTVNGTVNFGVTNISWFQFQGATYSADGTTLSLTGTTFSLITPVAVSNGGTGLATLTAHNVMIGEGTGNVAFAAPGTALQFLMSNGASSDPSFQALNALTAADVGFTDQIAEYNAAATADRSITVARLGGYVLPGLNGNRLYLTTGTPFPTADEAGTSSLFWGPAYHNRLCHYDGTRWVESIISEISIAATSVFTAFAAGTANCTTTNTSFQVTAITSTTGWYAGMTIKDSKGAIPANTVIVSVDSSSQVTMSAAATATNTANDTITVYNAIADIVTTDGTVLQSYVWTNMSTRTTAITYQDGVPLVGGFTYLGTVVDGGGLRFFNTGFNTRPSKRYTWNYYNQIEQEINMYESTSTWNYNTTTWEVMNGATTLNYVGVVIGIAKEAIQLTYKSMFQTSVGGLYAVIAISDNSTTQPDAVCQPAQHYTGAANTNFPLDCAKLYKTPSDGWHQFFPLEQSNASGTGTCTFTGVSGSLGTSGPIIKTGIVGRWKY